MQRNYLAILPAMLLVVGCPSREPREPRPPDAPAATALDADPVASKEGPGERAAKERGAKQKGKPQKDVPKDQFGFPLHINIEVPEVPEKLLKPSPPIKEPV